jgi:hypothetical protein
MRIVYAESRNPTAGDWFLIAWHTAPVDVSVPNPGHSDRQRYQLSPRLMG